MKSENTDIIIIGAGLTGLSIGYYLKKAGRKITIIERENNPGGVINTLREDGFIFETGPNTGVLSTPEIALLFEELKDRCTLELADPKSKKRYILKSGRWEPLPSGPISAIRTPLFTLKDKFRILGEPFRKPGKDPDETIAQLVIRRMGKSYLDYAVDPFISGIYAGDPEKLITRFALPKLYALEQNYGSFIRGAIAKSREQKSEAWEKATREVFSARGGLWNLIRAIGDEIGEEKILTNCKNALVSPTTAGYEVSFSDDYGEKKVLAAPIVITTTGGHSLPSILPFIPEELIKNISGLKYAGIVQVTAGYQKWNGKKLDAFGGLVPSGENRNILGILFPSAMFKERAPEGGALLSIFLGGVKKPDFINKPDSEIISITLKEIGDTLLNHDHPDLLRIYRYAHAIPQYYKSTETRLESINKIEEKYPGLILAGNIRDGIGMADRVRQARCISDMLK